MKLELNFEKKKIRKTEKIIKFFKQLFAKHDHLSKYLPIMTQSKQFRICRMINDSSLFIQKNEYIFDRPLPKFLFPTIKIFEPTQISMLIWYWFIFFAIFYYYIQMGLVLTYGQQVWEDQMNGAIFIFADVFTITIFFIDIVICLNCGYLYRGMIIMDHKRITSNYLRKHALIDIISLIIVIICPTIQNYKLNYLKFWLLLKVIRLFQIDDFYLRKLNIYRKSKAIYVVFKLMVIIYLLSHMIGLIFYAMDNYLCNVLQYYPQSFCWLYSSTAYSPIYSLSYPLQYLYTIYWGINTITTISYGDIAPNNPIEVNYAILCFCFGFMVYAYVVNQIVQIILWARQHEDQFRSELILIDTYMDKMRISRELRKNVHDYLHFVHKQQKNRDLEMQAQMIEKIPEELRIQLLKNAYEVFYLKMLSIFNTQEIIRIFFYLNEKKYTHHQVIFNQNERANSLFYLSKGNAQFTIKHGNSQTKIYQTQTQNQLLGHYQVFIRKRWEFSAMTTVSTLIYSIDRMRLMDQINKKTSLRERFKFVQYSILFRSELSLILYQCYFCKKQHHFTECPDKFPQFSIDYTQMSKYIKEDEYKRWKKPRMNTLILNKQMNSLRKMRKQDSFQLITKVEKMLNKIKQKIEQKNRQFEVDSAYDWEIYFTNFNFSKLREIWNKRFVKPNK